VADLGPRHLISLADLDSAAIRALVDRGAWYAAGNGRGAIPLRGLVVGIYFRTTSTRTRTAFSAGALQLGAQIVTYGPRDLQENTGETVGDTTRVLSGMLDGLVARTSGPEQEMRAFASQSSMAVVNAMSLNEHPTQALADLATIKSRLGSVDGIRMLYVGDGNNTAVAMVRALGHFREVDLRLRTPPGYGVDPMVLEQSEKLFCHNGGRLEHSHDHSSFGINANIVYTTRWQTTGVPKTGANWRDEFRPFQLCESVLDANPEALVMHDLPAHRGEEITASVLDGPSSVAFEQARTKLPSAKAVLEWCLT
jgi:ornithine carbamoyltransferase